MRLERSGQSSRRFGRAAVSIQGPARFAARPAERWPLTSIDLPDRLDAHVIATFGVDPEGGEPASEPITIEIELAGDADLLVALALVDGDIRAWHAESAGAGRAVIHLDFWRVGGDVRVFECSTMQAAEALFQRFEPPVAMAEPPMAMAEPPEPPAVQPPVDLEPAEEIVVSGQRPMAPRLPTGAETAREVEERPPRAAVPVHAMAQMPPSARVETFVEVRFTLSWQRVAPEAGAVVDVAELDIDPDRPVTISISAHGFRLAKGTRRVRSVRLHRARAKQEITFRLQAVDIGPGEVTLVVRQHHETPLATLRLTSEIVRGAASGTQIPVRATVTAPERRVVALPTIRIDESLVGAEATLDVAVQIGAASVTGATKRIDKARVVSEAYDRIMTLSITLKEEPDPEERKRVGLDELRSIGVDLARKVFTREVRRFLWQHRDALDHLFIQTTGEFDIPWELIYVSDPDETVEGTAVVVDRFLGMCGATRWVYNSAWKDTVTVGRGRAKYLCPSYRDRRLSLTFTQGEGRFVRSLFKARVVRPGDAASMSKIITGGFDLLHFAGHGVWTASPPDQRLLLADYRRSGSLPAGSSYSATELRRDLPAGAMVDPAQRAPMVFLNACDVGRLDTSAPGLGGFPEAFIRGGVGILLGCCWVVDDRVAGRFVRDFYEALQSSDVHDAMGRARRSALESNDLSGLAYVAYAHPYATVTIA